MTCYRVQVPIGRRVAGVTADGHRTFVLPGEYVAHRLPTRLTRASDVLLRLVGADPVGRDVHVSLAALNQLARAHDINVSVLDETTELDEVA